jgi:D-alanyl-D-alanine carboxypeptidase
VRQILSGWAILAASLAAALAAVIIGPVDASAAVTPAYIVIDGDSGKVLSHRSSDRLWYPASLTKLMTTYVIFKAMRDGEVTKGSPVKVSKNALAQAPTKMGFGVGTVMTVDNALKMLIVKSANDIAVALGETIAGSEAAFIVRMNAEARRLGMASTRFRNPNGLPGGEQWTTARDMAVLGMALWNDFPQHRDYFQITAIRVGKKVLRTYNTLLRRYRGANGMKTGYTCSSGFNVVGSATRDGRTLFVVVLGSSSGLERAELAARLMNKGFGNRFGLAGKPSLATFRSGRARGAQVNLREDMCSAAGRKRRAEAKKKKKPTSTSLVPRFSVMDPVRVYTGRIPRQGDKVPLPRFRPERIKTSAAL